MNKEKKGLFRAFNFFVHDMTGKAQQVQDNLVFIEISQGVRTFQMLSKEN